MVIQIRKVIKVCLFESSLDSYGGLKGIGLGSRNTKCVDSFFFCEFIDFLGHGFALFGKYGGPSVAFALFGIKDVDSIVGFISYNFVVIFLLCF